MGIFNTAQAPTDDINTRKMMIHAVNKADIIEKELAGLDEPVDSLFPKAAPYCGIDLTPRWDYDIEKAELLCSGETEFDVQDEFPDGAIVGLASLGMLFFLSVSMM